MSAMILGAGVDLVGLGRFDRAVSRSGEGLLDEFLTPREREWCNRALQPSRRGAVCFAAKEAFYKALGTGRTGRLSFKDVELISATEAATGNRDVATLVISGQALREAEDRGVRRVHVSVSCPSSGGCVAAWVVVEGASGETETRAGGTETRAGGADMCDGGRLITPRSPEAWER